MKENAIKITDKIEKVYIDLSSLESIQASTSFKRLYTIHTANTINISLFLGFHIGGFCDDRGTVEFELAEEISGYDYLPSELYLCLMDASYNFLPLNEEELDKLYNYLVENYLWAQLN